MRIKIITPNQYGRIEFSKEELEKILGEAYNEGYTDGRNYQASRGVYVDNLINCTTPCITGSYTGDTAFVTGLTTLTSNANTSVDATVAATTATAELDLE